MSANHIWDVTGRRDRRVQLAQAQVSVCLLGAALLMREAASDLRGQGIGWQEWSWPLATAAVAAAAAAVLPWLWAGMTVRAQRALTWTSTAVGGFIATTAMVVLDLTAAVGVQLALGGALLSEMASRRSSSRWFWGTAFVIWATFAVYQWTVGLRPSID
jgi:hypothetical protein